MSPRKAFLVAPLFTFLIIHSSTILSSTILLSYTGYIVIRTVEDPVPKVSNALKIITQGDTKSLSPEPFRRDHH